ncbi:MAG: agmatine deiminase family protein [Saprospiraceae bacterium]
MKISSTTITLLLCCHLGIQAQSIVNYAPQLPVRTMAEWEEEQAIAISWDKGFSGILTEIVRNAQKEVDVIIVCSDSTFLQHAKSRLSASQIDLSQRIRFYVRKTNSIWIRDYGPNTVYYNDVDSLAFVDWRYNRTSRTSDDVVSEGIAGLLKKSVFKTISGNEDLVNTGGNFMSDGMGTAFASKLVYDENQGKPSANSPFATYKSPEKVDSIFQKYMGIQKFITMNTLPYDGIHHIDMHMKLLDEETLLVGQYPDGISDGPQIEANIQFVLSKFRTPYGNPYQIIRIPMPADASGKYPSQNGIYRTYTNAVFVNKTVLLPTYEQKYDSTALKIWRKALPGHKIVGINCNAIIPQSGAIHCITKEIGVDEPLLINHSRIRFYLKGNPDNPGYALKIIAQIKHRSGISEATVYFRRQNESTWNSISMLAGSNPTEWVGVIPDEELALSDSIYYYISAKANNGKQMNRPISGENGAWEIWTPFYVSVKDVDHEPKIEISKVYPNPAAAITCIEINSENSVASTLQLFDINGRLVREIFSGDLSSGLQRFFCNAADFQAGVYLLLLKSKGKQSLSRLIISN